MSLGGEEEPNERVVRKSAPPGIGALDIPDLGTGHKGRNQPLGNGPP